MLKQMKQHQHRIYPLLDMALIAVNYIFHIFTSWYLIPAGYGVLSSLLSLIAILIVAGIAFQTHTAQKTAGDGMDSSIFKAAVLFCLGIVLLLFLLSNAIQNLLGCDLKGLFLIGVIFVVNSFVSIFRGYLQGKKEFLRLNISNYTEVVVKCLLVAVLLPIFRTVEAVLLTILAGMTSSLLYSLFSYLQLKAADRGKAAHGSLKSTSSRVMWIYVSSFFFYYFTSIDMIIVNYYLRDQSGVYAVTMKYAQIAVYIAMSLVTVFLPTLSSSRSGDRTFRNYMLRCFGVVSVVEAGILLLNLAVMPFTVKLFFASGYRPAGGYVFAATIPCAMLGLSFFLINVNIARERKGYLWILLAFSAALLFLLNLFHGDIGQVIAVEGIVYFTMFVVLLVHLFQSSGIFERDGGNQMIPEQYRKLEKSQKMTILFLSWRDIKCPKAGGAEVYTHEMLKRIDFSKYRILHISPVFPGCMECEELDNIVYLRSGGILSVILFAIRYYFRNRENIDFVVDQCNTHQFLSPLWVGKKKRIFFIHQLTREIWRINAKPPVGAIGEFLETKHLRLHRKSPVMTVSGSTRKDLLEIGFDPSKVEILPEGIEFDHWKPEDFLPKEECPTFIYVGRFVNYKGIDDAVKAFVLLRKSHPQARLWIVGKKNDIYIRDILVPLMSKAGITHGGAGEGKDVTFWGFVDEKLKLELMSRAHALIFPSRREGWGLIITEAAAVGTPSAGYPSPGIVDALNNGNAGYLCAQSTPQAIRDCMGRVIDDKAEYEEVREKAYRFSLNFHWKHTAQSFNRFVAKISNRSDLVNE